MPHYIFFKRTKTTDVSVKVLQSYQDRLREIMDSDIVLIREDVNYFRHYAYQFHKCRYTYEEAERVVQELGFDCHLVQNRLFISKDDFTQFEVLAGLLT